MAALKPATGSHSPQADRNQPSPADTGSDGWQYPSCRISPPPAADAGTPSSTAVRLPPRQPPAPRAAAPPRNRPAHPRPSRPARRSPAAPTAPPDSVPARTDPAPSQSTESCPACAPQSRPRTARPPRHEPHHCPLPTPRAERHTPGRPRKMTVNFIDPERQHRPPADGMPLKPADLIPQRRQGGTRSGNGHWRDPSARHKLKSE